MSSSRYDTSRYPSKPWTFLVCYSSECVNNQIVYSLWFKNITGLSTWMTEEMEKYWLNGAKYKRLLVIPHDRVARTIRSRLERGSFFYTYRTIRPWNSNHPKSSVYLSLGCNGSCLYKDSKPRYRPEKLLTITLKEKYYNPISRLKLSSLKMDTNVDWSWSNNNS